MLLGPGDLKGILITAVFAIIFCTGLVLLPTVNWKVNWGFDEGWDCRRMERGGPICVKRDTPKAVPATENQD